MMDSSCDSLPFNFYHILLGLVLGEAIGLMIWVMFGYAYRFSMFTRYVIAQPQKEESKKASAMLLKGIFSLVLCLLVVRVRTEEVDSRKVYCYRSCFANLVLTSPFVGSKVATPICSAFKSLPKCLYKCDRILMRTITVSNMMTRCNAREGRLEKYRACVDRHLPAAFEECSKSCQRKMQKADSIFEELNVHCRTIKCRLPCTITELNKKCKVAGNHIFGTYIVPFDTIATVMERYKNMREALTGMPKHCKFLFDLDDEKSSPESAQISWDDWKKPRNFAAPEETTTSTPPTTASTTTMSTTTQSHSHFSHIHVPRPVEVELEADNLLEVTADDESQFIPDEH